MQRIETNDATLPNGKRRVAAPGDPDTSPL